MKAASNMAGSVVDAMIAARCGSGFVRRVLLTVVVGLVVSLGWKLAAGV